MSPIAATGLEDRLLIWLTSPELGICHIVLVIAHFFYPKEKYSWSHFFSPPRPPNKKIRLVAGYLFY